MISATIKNIPLVFKTDKTIFAPKAVDAGTLAMLSIIDFAPNDKVLDLGCGYGIVGILAAKIIGSKNVIMCDISETAVQYSKVNAELNQVMDIDIKISDGYKNITDNDFTLILSNPPYHTDFFIAKNFIEGGYNRLVTGGRMVMVTKRLTWYKNKLSSVFGGVKVHEIDGYYVFVAEKRSSRKNKLSDNRKKMSNKLKRKYGYGSMKKPDVSLK
ncbi:MAG: class I SAM-dependent methyltransferase [Butyrivibrio sp.]|nr:class I SAM-dependent methyltransferase [Butyrivibrio sp.]